MSQELSNTIRTGAGMLTVGDATEVFSPMNMTNKLLDQLSNVHSWEDFKKACETKQLHGNTRNTDLFVLGTWFYCKLRINDTAEELDYATFKNGIKTAPGSSSVYFRLKRINADNIFVIIEALILLGVIPREKTIDAINKCSRMRGKYKRFYTKWYVTGALEVFKDNIQNTANFLGVAEAAIRYWRDMATENVLLQRGDND